MGRGNWREMVKRYRLPVIRQMRARGVMCNMTTIVNAAVWYV